MSKARKWALAIGIAIVLAMFVNYGVQTFSPGPKYEDYCTQRFYPVESPVMRGSINCTAIEVNDSLKQSCQESKGYIDYEYNSLGCATSVFCETCQTDWMAAENGYNKNVFIVLTIIGALSIIAGILIKVDSVAIGFLMGGILNIIIGTLRYWSGLQDVGRFLILGAVLALLVWAGIKKVRD